MITTLGLLAVFLVLIILFQVFRSADLLQSLDRAKTGDLERTTSRGANNFNATMMIIFLIGFLILTFWSAFYYAPRYLPQASSEHGVILRAMFQRTLWATVPVFVICHILLFLFAYNSKNEKGKIGTHFAHSTKLEVIWTLIPAVVMVVLVVDGIINWNRITGPASPDAMVIEATAQQFKWDLRYSGADNMLGNKSIALIGDNNAMGQDWNDKANYDDFLTTDLHLPVNKEVLVKINSQDVLHSFALPHFRVKMDAVPGIPTQFKFVPTVTTAEMKEMYGDDFEYELACMELCGKAHFNMRRIVTIETQEEFDAWSAEQVPYFKQLEESSSIDFEKFPNAKQAAESLAKERVAKANEVIVSELKTNP